MSASTDFVIIGFTTDTCGWDRTTCLDPSLHNPKRAALCEVSITSNNKRISDFVLVESTANSADCYDDLETHLLEKSRIKSAFRKEREAREARSPSRIIYHWRLTAPLSVTPAKFYIERDTGDTNPGNTEDATSPLNDSSVQSFIMQKHNNKFGTPVPSRRVSSGWADEAPVEGKARDREERSSNDSVMAML